MLKIRLQRTGKIHQPHYRVVVAEASAPRDGRFVAILGHIHPMEEDLSKKSVIDLVAVNDWMVKGAQPTNVVKKYISMLSKSSDISSLDRVRTIKYSYSSSDLDGISKEELKKKKDEKVKADAEYLKQKKAKASA